MLKLLRLLGRERSSSPDVTPESQPQPLQRHKKKVKKQSRGLPRRAAASPGQISQVTDGNFDSLVLAAQQPVLVDFWAEWCGPCRAMAPILEEVAAELGATARVTKLDVERNPVTAGRFGIRNIPTMILFQGGEVKDVLVGLQSRDKLVRLLSRAAA